MPKIPNPSAVRLDATPEQARPSVLVPISKKIDHRVEDVIRGYDTAPAVTLVQAIAEALEDDIPPATRKIIEADKAAILHEKRRFDKLFGNPQTPRKVADKTEVEYDFPMDDTILEDKPVSHDNLGEFRGASYKTESDSHKVVVGKASQDRYSGSIVPDILDNSALRRLSVEISSEPSPATNPSLPTTVSDRLGSARSQISIDFIRSGDNKSSPLSLDDHNVVDSRDRQLKKVLKQAIAQSSIGKASKPNSTPKSRKIPSFSPINTRE